MDEADALQPDPLTRDNYYWSHSARFYNRRSLAAAQGDGWQLREGVPNTGIHIVLGGLHVIRVLKSLNGSVPHAGNNKARREAWSQPAAQTELFLSADNRLFAGAPDDVLPAMHLLIDWHVAADGKPATFVSLPRTPWGYLKAINVHWRRPFPGQAGSGLEGLSFNPGPDSDDFGTVVRIDTAELDAG